MNRTILPGPGALAACLAALLSPSCGPNPTVEAAAAFPAALEVPWEGGARLVAYRWDSGARIQLPPGGVLEPRTLTFGELGQTPQTAAYLRFEDELQRELAGFQRLRGRAEGGSAAPGRFGGGWRLGAADRLHLLLSEALPHNHWTLEAWVKPEGPAGTLFEIPGILRASLGEDGRLLARLESLPPTELVSATTLDFGGWNHVAVVVDARDLDHLRLVVNGGGASTDFRAANAPAAPAEFVLGALDSGSSAPVTLDEVRFQARPAATSELIESHGNPGRRATDALVLEFADGSTQRLELWPRPLRGSRLTDAASTEGMLLDHLVRDAAGWTWVPGDFERVKATDPPTPRTTHPTLHLGDGKVFVFGGETLDSHFGPFAVTDDTWIFDTRESSWRRIDTPKAPQARCHQGSAYSPDHGIVFYAGGFRNDRDPVLYFRDAWAYVVAEERWEPRSPIPRRSGAANCGLEYLPRERRFALFCYETVYLYDPTTDEWETRKPRSVDEQGRPVRYTPWASPITGYDPVSGRVVLFGGGRDGEQGREYCNTTALYDVEANTFILLAPEQAPSPRVRAAFAYDTKRERFVLFGGVQAQFSERERDLWTFDVAERRWRQHLAADVPTARGGYYGMAYDEVLDRFFILCGRHAPHSFLNEAVSLSLDERAPGTLRVLFDRRAAAPDEVWFAEHEAPGTSQVSYRFRTSADARGFGPWGTLEDFSLVPAAYVQVEVTLRPGEQGEVPRIRDLGFAAP